MYSLNRLVLIDSYKPGTLQEVRLDGATNLNGVNGAGKTTLLRLVPLFFGESPSRLVPKSRVNESFVQHYLPHDSSYIIFEYQRSRQTCLVVMYAALNEGALCYRFVDKGFVLEDFVVADSGGDRVPVSCRDLARHLRKQGVYCSPQLTARSDYRTVIQNLPHAKGAEMRQLISRFSFCESVKGRRLQHSEKIVTGMFMRSSDFRDLREMLVSCIEEDRESIVLELKTDTLDSWCKEYRAFLRVEEQRERMAELDRVEEAAMNVRQELAEVAARVRRLASRTAESHSETEKALREQELGLDELKAAWEAQERELKREQAETEAVLDTRRQQLRRLEQEQADWARQDIEHKQRLYESREALRDALERARENHARLVEKVKDIDAEFGRLKAEKEKEHQQRIHQRQSRRHSLELTAERDKNEAREDASRREAVLREAAEAKEREINLRLQALKEMRGGLKSQLQDVQADGELLEAREVKREALADANAEQETARERLEELNGRIRAHQTELGHLEQSRRQLADSRQQICDEEAALQRQLDADASTLLGFLREHHPGWTGHIAKVIRPELLLREDLSPALSGNEESFYGLGLALEQLSADRAASEAALQEALADCRDRLDLLAEEERKLDAEVATHRKTWQGLNKEQRALDLALGQWRGRIKQIKEEISSLDRQVEASKREREGVLRKQLQELEADLHECHAGLEKGRSELKTDLSELRRILDVRLEDVSRGVEEQSEALSKEIARLEESQRHELAELETQRLASLAQGGVDTKTLADLEGKIRHLEGQLKAADQAADAVEKYQRWLQHEWPRHRDLQQQVEILASRLKDEQARYQAGLADFQKRREAFKAQIADLEKQIAKLAAQLTTLGQMQQELERYPRLSEGSVALDAAHTVAFLQKQKHELMAHEREIQKSLVDLVGHLKRALNQFPGTQPASYYETVLQEVGLDAPDHAWLPHLRDWYASRADELRRWLAMQASTFGSAVRNYHQALERFDRGIDSLSRRLAASIDRNIGFDKIEAIHARLISNVSELGYWHQIVAFTELYDQWQRDEEMLLPAQDFADAVQLIASQLQSQGRVETRLVNLLSLEIAVTENGKVKRATHDEELRQISSHGLSYLILCVFFVALVNMIRRDQPVRVVWPMDELKDLHQMNIERLLVILNDNNITLFSAFPDPHPEVLKSFRNRYEIYGYRELVEMVVSDADSAPLENSPGELPACLG